MAKCLCVNAACTNRYDVVAVHFHKDLGPNWFRIVPKPDQGADGKPLPVPCPDDLLDSEHYIGQEVRLDGFDGQCQQSIPARILYCYTCKTIKVYPATPVG